MANWSAAWRHSALGRIVGEELVFIILQQQLVKYTVAGGMSDDILFKMLLVV